MRVALIDPSLFTLPYDAALASALERGGDQVVLHARARRERDGHGGGISTTGDFYPVAETTAARRLPALLRLPIKGLDHAASLLRLVRRLRFEQPDVIHFQWLPLPVADLPALAALRRVAPLVLTVHDTRPFNGNPASVLQRLGHHRAFAMFDRLIVHTRQGAARLGAFGVDASRLVVLPHGPLATPRAAEDGEEGCVTFLLFGKIKPYKGADLLIEAFAALPPALRRRARVQIVGQPYMDVSPLESLVARHGVAEFCRIVPEFVPDTELHRWFGPGVVAVFPYREIEASGVLSLAVAHACPIIASRIGAFAETLVDGVHGRLFEVGDVAALSAALAEMIGDPEFRRHCVAAVRELAQGSPGWDDIAVATRAVYREAERERAASLI